jgi:signal transduction histidine kinase
MEAGASPPRRRAAGTIALVGLVPFVVWFALADHSRLTDPLTFVLAAGALAANLFEVRVEGSMWVSAAAIFGMLAAAFLGPGPAFVVVALGEVGAWLAVRFDVGSLAINGFGTVAPTMLAAAAMQAWAPDSRGKDVQFDLFLAAVTAGAIVLNAVLVPLLGTMKTGGAPLANASRLARQFLPLHALTVALVLVVAQVYRQIGLSATTSLIVVGLAFTYVLRLLVSARERGRQVDALSASRGHLVAEALNAEDRERRLLAQRLHDEAVQNLLTARQDLEEAEDSPELSRARSALEETIRQLRNAVFDLHPAVLDYAGLEAALEAVGEQQAERAGFRISVEVQPAASGIHDQLLFSIGRELLSNVAKHAGASAVGLRIQRRDGALHLEVVDDGIGLDAEQQNAAVRLGHIGLASIVERAAALDGYCDVDSSPNKGTRIHVAVPIPQPSTREQP